MSADPIVVLGATGKTGRRVCQRLEALGHATRPASRRSPTLFDWDRPETWGPTLRGARAAYVTYSPDLAVPGAVAAVEALCVEARRAGVQHLVLLSGRGEYHAQQAEQRVQASGLSWTLVRAAWFAENFSEGELRMPVTTGVFSMPGGAVKEPIVSADDIADVVVAALTQPGLEGQVLEVTGPALLSFAEMATLLSAASGRAITYQPVSFEAFEQGLAPAIGDDMAALVAAIARETLDGRNAWVGDGVRRALGREPRSFEGFAQAAAAAGAWSSSPAAA